MTNSRSSRAQCSWIENSSIHSSSTESTISSSHPPIGGPPSSLDAETLGAYLSSYITEITENSTPQQSSSQDALTITNQTSEENLIEGAKDDVECNYDTTENCVCEGACGCAISVEDRMLLELIPPVDEPRNDLPSAKKNAIIKLLGRSTSISRSTGNTNLNSSTVSMSSTPISTLERPMSQPNPRSPSTCSKESCVTGISALSSKYSNDEPQYEFDIVSETTSIGRLTVANTPDARLPSRARRYSSCDLESFYQGMNILDSFLTARGIPILKKRNQSVETLCHVGSEYFFNNGSSLGGFSKNRNNSARRIWRSTDDALII